MLLFSVLRHRRALRLLGAGLLAAACSGCISIVDTGPSSILTEARTQPDTAVVQDRTAVAAQGGRVISVRN
ncbi:hypothetical protein [Salinarimonas soli]|uniref:Uncharacterized protein n=1 Tax=Salinarimonas soli TaxID=1638099 RepID=A0A5B2VH74_9HYPH|nr:hypothetical protein [Salinarimonas soli]KAA2237830.1 hypothetical protein F0L46_07480 [Salinarimonas soli]